MVIGEVVNDPRHVPSHVDEFVPWAAGQVRRDRLRGLTFSLRIASVLRRQNYVGYDVSQEGREGHPEFVVGHRRGSSDQTADGDDCCDDFSP